MHRWRACSYTGQAYCFLTITGFPALLLVIEETRSAFGFAGFNLPAEMARAKNWEMVWQAIPTSGTSVVPGVMSATVQVTCSRAFCPASTGSRSSIGAPCALTTCILFAQRMEDRSRAVQRPESNWTARCAGFAVAAREAGIPEEAREKIFDLFFTAREVWARAPGKDWRWHGPSSSRTPVHFARSLAQAEQEGAPLLEVEEKLIQLSHAEVGAYLLSPWGLPYTVVEAVALTTTIPGAYPPRVCR